MTSLDLDQPLEIERDKTESPRPRQHCCAISSKCKFIMILLFSFSITILISVYKPAKVGLLYIGSQVKLLGWFGPVLLALINGCVAIPFGLPYIVFEMVNSLLNSNYWIALASSLCSKAIGCSIVYYVTKFHLRAKILRNLKKKRFYKGVEVMLERNPLKFSIIIRIIVIPFSIKNYCLAVPECINYWTYLAAAILGSFHESAIDIYLFQKAQDIDGLLSGNTPPIERAFSIIMIVLSLLCLLYVVLYSRKVLQDIKSEAQALHPEGHSSTGELPNDNKVEKSFDI